MSLNKTTETSILKLLNQYESEASKPIRFHDGVTARDGVIITEINERVLKLTKALKRALSALHYAEEDRCDRYYTNVREEIEALVGIKENSR